MQEQLSLYNTGTGPWKMIMIGSGYPVAFDPTTSVQLHSYGLKNTSPVSPSDACIVRLEFVFVMVQAYIVIADDMQGASENNFF